MSGNAGHVKQLLSSARMYRRPDMLSDIVREVRDAEATTGRLSAELRVLCAEVAVELKQWPAAAELLKGLGNAQETRLLAVRRAFCDVLVALHHVDENTSLTEEERVREYVTGAASVLQALAEGVEVWPESLDAVLTGIRTLWLIISPLLAAGHDADVCDAVVFLATLHQQLRIGGGYTLVQWLVRAALCLRAAERLADAAVRFSAALEAAAVMGQQRLFVQVLRLAAGAIFVKEKSGISAKTRSELLPSYRGRPVHFAVLLTQLVLGGHLEMDACREDLQSAYEGLSDSVDAAPPPPDAGAPASRGKKKQAAAKPAPAMRLVDAFAVTETEVVDEVKSDVLFCVSLHGTLSPEQLEELRRRRYSSNRRVRSFSIFALVVDAARRHGLTRLSACADASSISAAHRAELHTLAGELIGVLKNTNAIHDESERQHTVRVAAALLWNLVLPFLQSGAAGDVQPALAAITDVAEASLPALRELFLQVATQQCKTAYEDDNRSVLHHLLPTLERECERGEVDGAAQACLFRLQWMQHQIAIRDEPEGGLTTSADRCLFAIEQARWIANPLKRIPVIKTAFRHLPPIMEEADVPANAGTAETPVSHTAAQDTRGAAAATATTAAATATTRRSTVHLYREMLELCMQDLSPSLHAVAVAVAEALRCLPGPAGGDADAHTEEVRAVASLHAATILARQLEEAEPHGAAKEARPVRAVDPRAAAAEDREGRLASLLIEAAKRGAELENRRRGSGGWIAANACVTFLNWKKAVYTRGEYRLHLPELLELQKLYTGLFERDQVQDVELLSDLTQACALGLVADYLATAKALTSAAASPMARSVARSGFAALVQRIRTCAVSETTHAQLRRAHALCLDAMRVVPVVKRKWFLAMLSPALARLVGDKPAVVVHPQEQLLIVLGILAGPSPTADKVPLLFSDARPLLRRDPCVRLCAWVAAVAMQLQQEEVALECCEVADRLYATNRLGWGSVFEAPSTTSPSAGVSALAGKVADGVLQKKPSVGAGLAQQPEAPPAYPKPDAEDWEAYAQLLSIKAQVGVAHLQGLNGDARNRAVRLLLTNCVNSAIAAVQGPASSKVEHITNAYGLYYTLLRTTRLSLQTATFALPSLRMLLSKALLAQLPKRSWSDSFTDVVYQLSCVLVFVSFSSPHEEDARQLAGLLRHLRDQLPPRYQKALKAREVTEVCYSNPSVDGFLQMSRNMEAELQARGWLIVGQAATDASSEAEAFALALAAAQGSTLATAQCLFEHAYTTTRQLGEVTPLAHVTAHLQKALRTLEELPETAPLLQSAEETQRWAVTLADASLTATFLRTAERHPHPEDAAAAAVKAPKKAHTTKITGVTFHHVFLALRIVALLFRTSATGTDPHDGNAEMAAAASTSAAAAAAAHRGGGRAVKTATVSRLDCANLMLDYISCLWHLSAKWLREVAVAGEEAVVLTLPATTCDYYGFAEPPAAAQRLRRCVPDEEFQLNTEGLWQCLLELGDHLVRSGDERRAFLAYSWVRFAAALAFGDATGDSRCVLVQRLCNMKMCVAAASSGLSDRPYVAALAALAGAKALVEEAVKRDVEGKCVAPSWEAAMVVGECELRIHLGLTEEAAVLAEDVLCRGLECASWSAPTTKARALRVRARHEAMCSRHHDALLTLEESFALIGAPNGHPAAASFTAMRLWAELAGDRLAVLMEAHLSADAVEWAGTVRHQLCRWRAVAAVDAAQGGTVRAASVRVEAEDALAIWVGRVVPIVAQALPLVGVAAHRHVYSSQPHRAGAAGELLREVQRVTEGSHTLHSQFFTALAQWHVRERVTPQWFAKNGANVDEVRTWLLVLLEELRRLDQLVRQVQRARASRDAASVALSENTDAPAATSLAFWQAAIVFWIAVDRLEASRLASCILAAFRRLTMADLQLPTSSAPAHCEKAVLKFIRGAATTAVVAAGAERAAAASAARTAKLGDRWVSDAAPDAEELAQALQHYGVADAPVRLIMNVSDVPRLLESAAAHCRDWPNTRLSAAILVAIAQVELVQRLENEIECGDDMIGEELSGRMLGLLTTAWRRARLVPARSEKPGSRTRKSVAAAKRRSLSEQSPSAPTRPLTPDEEALLERISLGIQVAVHNGLLDMAAQLAGELSHLAVLMERPQLAAAAAEQTQMNQLVGLLWRDCVTEMVDSPEGRLWRQMRAVQPFFTNCTAYMQLADQSMATTPMERGLRSCGQLCVEAERRDGEGPAPATGKGGHTTESSPHAIDSAVLSVAMCNHRSGIVVVALRHPDGVVEGRCHFVPMQTWATLSTALQRAEARKLDVLGNAAGVRAGTADERVTADDIAKVVRDLNAVATELFGEFAPSLQQYCERAPLYLCLAPELQPYPWEQTSALSCCPTVLRELGAAAVVSKISEPLRLGKRASQQLSKTAGPNSSKGAPPGPLVCLIDVFGDHRESIAATCGTDHTKSKVSPQSLITCSSAAVPPDPAYVTWMLRSAAPGALVVNTCGSLTDLVPWPHLASLSFTQLNGAVLVDGAANASSQQREERLRLTAEAAAGAGSVAVRAPCSRWMAQLLLLLRGAKFVAANTFACSPAVADVLARRCLSSASSGKALVEQLRGKSKDTKTPFVTLYGVLGSGPSKAKA
ncbi:hypothetical protein NESM_000654800 [Novymonas esmeraldas]|uniref:Non-specific serine/threonine protein kinase n=1 Tax=Novymonas esmeraldas TaxID=1808958 RepID=A0AAW0ESG7_9TRYP